MPERKSNSSAKHTLLFLLDEMMPPKKKLPRMNKRSYLNIRHITDDYGLSGIPDKAVLARAKKKKEF